MVAVVVHEHDQFAAMTCEGSMALVFVQHQIVDIDVMVLNFRAILDYPPNNFPSILRHAESYGVTIRRAQVLLARATAVALAVVLDDLVFFTARQTAFRKDGRLRELGIHVHGLLIAKFSPIIKITLLLVNWLLG